MEGIKDLEERAADLLKRSADIHKSIRRIYNRKQEIVRRAAETEGLLSASEWTYSGRDDTGVIELFGGSIDLWPGLRQIFGECNSYYITESMVIYLHNESVTAGFSNARALAAAIGKYGLNIHTDGIRQDIMDVQDELSALREIREMGINAL